MRVCFGTAGWQRRLAAQRSCLVVTRGCRRLLAITINAVPVRVRVRVCLQGFKDVMVYHRGADHPKDPALSYATIGAGFVAIPKR